MSDPDPLYSQNMRILMKRTSVFCRSYESITQAVVPNIRLHQIDFVFPVEGWLGFCPNVEEKKQKPRKCLYYFVNFFKEKNGTTLQSGTIWLPFFLNGGCLCKTYNKFHLA